MFALSGKGLDMATAITVQHIGCPICQAKVVAMSAKDDQALFRCAQCETMVLVPKIAWHRTTAPPPKS
jgi:NAD-dependent SIR2 family protein deacetylase